MPDNSVNRNPNDSNGQSGPTFGPTRPVTGLDAYRRFVEATNGKCVFYPADLADAELLRLRNEATRLEDAERRRWYAALEGAGLTNLEGLAPEVVAERVKTMHGALEDILTADETSTVAGAVAIARRGLDTPT